MQRAGQAAQNAGMPVGTVFIVEDHELLAQSLGVALAAEGLDVKVAVLGAGQDVLAQARAAQPQTVLLDLDLGERQESGEAFVPDLVELGARVVVVSGSS